jgi:simple sugar transport system permease protein
MTKNLFNKTEFLVGMTLVIMSVIIGVINPSFFSIANLFDILRSATVTGIFAMGVLIVIISGGVDVSFTAIGLFGMYVTVKILKAWGFEGTVLVAIVISGVIGLALGLINAVFISRFRLPTLIVTLGTSALYQGFMLFFIDSTYIRDIPEGMAKFSMANLITITQADGSKSNLHSAVLLMIAAAILMYILLKYTMLGRGVYALGGSRESAERAGFNITRIEFTIYGLVGLLAGIAGITFGSLMRQANPFSIVGTELDVIAAVVLGGASITGGRGSVVGAILGVLLITVLNNSLILLGIPSDWQKVVVGIVLIIGTALPAIQNRRAERRMNATLAE